jgi:hypothetical protein
MKAVVLAGRWMLAGVIAFAALFLVAISVLATIALANHEHVRSLSAQDHVTAIWLGTFAGIWAGSATLPATQRKFFITLLGGLWIFFLTSEVVSEILAGTWNGSTMVVLSGTAMGGLMVKRRLWESLPAFGVLEPNDLAPQASTPPAPPSTNNVHVGGRSAGGGKAAFGRRG